MDKQLAKKAEKYMKLCKSFAEAIYPLMKSDGLIENGALDITIGNAVLKSGIRDMSIRYEAKYKEPGEWFDNQMMMLHVSEVFEKNEANFDVGWNNVNSSKVEEMLGDDS